jgi:hypothetical protein
MGVKLIIEYNDDADIREVENDADIIEKMVDKNKVFSIKVVDENIMYEATIEKNEL